MMRAVWLNGQADFDALCREKMGDGIYETPSEILFLRVRPHGLFLTKNDGSGNVSLSYQRRLPRIPSVILEDVIAYFREDLTNEAAVRICFDETDSTFFFVKAGGVRSGASIRYDYSDSLDKLLRDGVVYYMDIHSHNTMRAFFSGVDDGDELSSPGAIYGVIGRLDREEPEIRLRAVCRGTQTALSVPDLFDTDRRYEGEPICGGWNGTDHAPVLGVTRALCGVFDVAERRIRETHSADEFVRDLARVSVLDILDFLDDEVREGIRRGKFLLFTTEGFTLEELCEDDNDCHVLSKGWMPPDDIEAQGSYILWPGFTDGYDMGEEEPGFLEDYILSLVCIDIDEQLRK